MSDNSQWGNSPNHQPPGNPQVGGAQNQQYQGQQQGAGFQQQGPPPGFPPYGQSPNGFPYGQQQAFVPQPGFWDCVKLFFTQYATFSGRSRRSEYWYVVLFQFILGLVFAILQVPQISNICSLVFLIPNLALQCRRLHDTGRSGHWIWLQLLATIFCIIAMFYFVAFVVVNMPGSLDALRSEGIDPSVFYSLSGLLNIPGLAIVAMLLAAVGIGITFLVFYCTDSQRGTNQYGLSPKYP